MDVVHLRNTYSNIFFENQRKVVHKAAQGKSHKNK